MGQGRHTLRQSTLSERDIFSLLDVRRQTARLLCVRARVSQSLDAEKRRRAVFLAQLHVCLCVDPGGTNQPLHVQSCNHACTDLLMNSDHRRYTEYFDEQSSTRVLAHHRKFSSQHQNFTIIWSNYMKLCYCSDCNIRMYNYGQLHTLS